MSTHAFRKRLGSIIGLLLFLVACWLLYEKLHTYKLSQILASMQQLPLHRVLIALAITGVNYALFTGYDVLAMRFAGKHLRYHTLWLNSFISYALSYNLGSLMGHAIRARVYSKYGLNAKEIAKALSFIILSFWIGFTTMAGVFFVISPLSLPPPLDELPFSTTAPLGIALLLSLSAYIIWLTQSSRTVGWRPITVTFPTPHLTLYQFLLASCDWLLNATVLYTVLPTDLGVPFAHFMSIFLLCQLLVVVSHVPAGIGLFESLLLFMLPTAVPTDRLFASLLVYRAVYFFVPLLVALLSSAFHQAYGVASGHVSLRRLLGLEEEKMQKPSA